MRALLASLFDPLAQTAATGEFGAGGAHDRVLDSAEADEAGEYLFKVHARGMRSSARAHLLMAS